MYHTLAISMILLLFVTIDPGEGRNVLVQTEEKQTETGKVALDLKSKTPGRIRSRNKFFAPGPQTPSATSDEFFCYECYWPDEHNPILQYTNEVHDKFWKSLPVGIYAEETRQKRLEAGSYYDTQGCTCTSSDPIGKRHYMIQVGMAGIAYAHGMDNCYDCDGGNNGPGHPGLWICNICCPCPGNPQRSLGPWNNVYSEQRTGYCKSNNSMMMYYTNDGGQNTMDGRGHTMKSCKDHHRNQKAYDNVWGVNRNG